ncbi:hypothetical protein QYE76_007401 [Lolium multiflorum]|uniref:RNase H type-1 domain-containing protein n=1 Tax=Lolium multiflorum TaxID=4521 RepID=A0AAD8S007_LOLMU|nr:hypothetical protein QYE76_007401 [Lolium multiflorum]
MNFDGSKRVEGAGAGVILISPEGDKLKYVLRMTFPNASNNEAEYEALIHGMKMAKACGATRLKIFGDSQLVAQQVMNQCDAVNDSMIAYKEVYNELEKLFDGCEVNHISRLSNDEADVLANIGSQCLPIPPGVLWEEIAERSTKPKKAQKKTKEEKTSAPLKEAPDEEEDQELFHVGAGIPGVAPHYIPPPSTFNVLLGSSWFDKPWFLSEGKLAAVRIIPSSWGSQRTSAGGTFMSITLGEATKLLDNMMINYSEWHTERAPQGLMLILIMFR